MAKKNKIKAVAIRTGGGDCPGLNAVIRSVTRTASIDYGWEVVGIQDGFEGLVEGRMIPLTSDSVSGILTQGGTILGASNRANPFHYQKEVGGQVQYKDVSKRVMNLFKDQNFDALFCVGGEGTMAFAKRFADDGLPIIGIPKTIDNDVPGTERTVGFYSAVATAADAVDKLHTTAASHHRVMVIEVMGRNAGWIALASSLAAGADIILVPEIPFDLKKVFERVQYRSSHGRRFTIVVVGEGARVKGGKPFVQKVIEKAGVRSVRLGGIGHWLANVIEEEAGVETRAVVLGHVLRGGPPIHQDRILATYLGFEAVHRLAKGEINVMVAWQQGNHVAVPLSEILPGPRLIPLNHPWLKVCEAMGSTFSG